MLPVLLKALTLAPQLFKTGRDVYEMVTGQSTDDIRSEEELVNRIETLPVDQQETIMLKVLDAKVKFQQLDTQRFMSMTEGDADKVRATARPTLALDSMKLMLMPFLLIRWLIILACLEWVIEAVAAGFGKDVDVPSLFSVFANMNIETVWPLVASVLVPAYLGAVAVIRKYMGCRERDKALQYEMQNGKPLKGLQATVHAASGIATLVNAFKGR